MTIGLAPYQITQRYQVLNQLGSGGMGVVYRALDRLTGEIVALKQVTVASRQLRFVSRPDDSQNVRLALAHEFKTLASIRHPNIVSVLDYGFDSQHQPFFTMAFLDAAQTLLQAGQNQPPEVQYGLLLQLLQALLYLHRRNILHRDLKPDNVLVANGQVKVVDFGLAVAHDKSEGTSGTLAYMAPELLKGIPASEASDLYAFGVIAYELLVGRHPFGLDPAAVPIENPVKRHTPDMAALHQHEALGTLIERLLADRPEARANDTGEVLVEFSTATGRQYLMETVFTRESFLQAAQFVGREAELEQLSGALDDTVNGHGALWLVAGESGIGKSRLLDELRTLALVPGVLVLRGQAISEGGTPYQLWRGALRQLCLQSALTNLEKSVLKPLVRDIDILLGEKVPDPLALDLEAEHDRLVYTICDVFTRLSQPTLVIFEDVQWAGSESIALLKRLSLRVGEKPLMLVASYRSDELFTLPDEFPDAHLLSLERLPTEKIADLSASILGEAVGRQTPLVDFLVKETEGNIFFIVEVLRALAEEVGQLNQIDAALLPVQVFSGGMQTVVQRRLNRVPDWAQPLLQAAAVAGRQIDPELLTFVEPQADIDQWIWVCAEVSVLDFQEGHWRFSHDKLRESVLVHLTDDLHCSLHQKVAEAIECRFPDPPGNAMNASALANHWAAAGQADKERYYAAIAGEQALARGAYHEAIDFLKRAVPQSHVEYELGEAYSGLGQFTESRHHYEQALSLLGHPIPTHSVTLILELLGDVIRQIVHRLWPAVFISKSHLKRNLLLAQCRIYQKLFVVYAAYQNQLFPALYSHFHSLNIAEIAGASPELVQAYAQSAYVISFGGPSPVPMFYYQRAQSLGKEVGDLPALLLSNAYLGAYQTGMGQWAAAEHTFQTALQLSEEVGEHRHRGEVMNLLTFISLMNGRFDQAAALASATTNYAVNHADSHLQIESLAQQLTAAIRQGHVTEIESMLEILISKIEPGVGFETEVWGYGTIALAQTIRGDLAAARNAADSALKAMKHAQPTNSWTLDSCSGTIQTYIRFWHDSTDAADQLQFKKSCEQALKYMNKLVRSFPICRPRSLFWKGVYQAHCGKPGAAHKLWQKGLTEAKRLSMPYDEALLHYEIGRHFPPEDKRGISHLWQAESLFKHIGAAYDLAYTRSALPIPVTMDTATKHAPSLALSQEGAQSSTLLEQFQQLAQISPLINSSLDQAEVLQEVMDATIRITHAERAYLMLLEPELNGLNIAVARNWEQRDLHEAEITFSQRIIRLVVESGEPLMTVNALVDPRFNQFESVRALQIRSVVCTPLVLRGKVIGALYADNSRSSDESSLPVLVAVAAQAATAIENARLFKQVETYAKDLRYSREQIVTVREEERRRLRRELHDGLGPLLAGIVLRIEAAQMRLLDDAPNLAFLETIRSKVQDAFNTMRRAVYDLRPPALDELGLLGALREYVDNLSGLDTTFDVPATLQSLPAAVEVAAYRIVLEALANVIRHARAKSCLIRIVLSDHELMLQIQDDGLGLPPDLRSGVGMSAMRERAGELGGVLQITSIKSGGTLVLAHLPIRAGQSTMT